MVRGPIKIRRNVRGPLQIGRNLSKYRIAAYECTIDGSAVKKGKWVLGWYRMFHEERLKQELMPKLAEYAGQGASYPFLITSYLLESKADVLLGTKDVKFRPRPRQTANQNEAVVYSRNRYKLLQ